MTWEFRTTLPISTWNTEGGRSVFGCPIFSSLARNLHHRISTSQPPPAVIHGPCGNPVTPPWENDGHGAVGSLHSAIARCEYEPFDHEPSAGPSATNQPANTDAVPVVKSSNAAAEGLALDMDVMSEGVRDRWLD